ncbi:MAG: DNA mismatch repair protein MutS, partial [Gemmatimonadales bacterium]
SAGLRGFREYVSQYAATAGFTTLAREAPRIAAELGALRYNLRIDDNRVTVLPRRGEPDFAALVLEAFDRFRRAPVQDYRTDFADPGRLNHVEAQILQGIARLHPATFRALAEFVAAHTEFIDPVLARFDREVQFYRAWRALVHPLEAAGRRFCYPGFTPSPGAVEIREGFDLALALRLGPAGPVVCNDLALDASERIVVVSGPNQGGKTTYARMVGQVHYLTRLGCSVPARSARVPVCDGVYAHFERREDPGSLRGKLKQDLERMREILARVTPASLVLVNEPFASTTLADALYLSRRVLERLTESGPLVVWVTFLDELAAFGPATVSLASAVDVAHPSLRTFRFERRPPDGLAYAHAVAEKYGLTAAWLVSGPVE